MESAREYDKGEGLLAEKGITTNGLKVVFCDKHQITEYSHHVKCRFNKERTCKTSLFGRSKKQNNFLNDN